MFGALPIFDVRADFGIHELANRVADKGLVVGEGEVHGFGVRSLEVQKFNGSRVQEFGSWFDSCLSRKYLGRIADMVLFLMDGGAGPGNGRKRKKEKITLRRGGRRGARRNHESHLHWGRSSLA